MNSYQKVRHAIGFGRLWKTAADISAETAGEQYTPDDIISLITELIVVRLEDNGKFLTIYDPTCGGGNLLFGVEDKIKSVLLSRHTATYGEDWNDIHTRGKK